MVLRVKLEIVPFGDEERAREIGRLDIFNKGKFEKDPSLYHYGVIELTPQSGGLHTDSIYHERALGAWELVRTALDQLPIDGPDPST